MNDELKKEIELLNRCKKLFEDVLANPSPTLNIVTIQRGLDAANKQIEIFENMLKRAESIQNTEK